MEVGLKLLNITSKMVGTDKWCSSCKGIGSILIFMLSANLICPKCNGKGVIDES